MDYDDRNDGWRDRELERIAMRLDELSEDLGSNELLGLAERLTALVSTDKIAAGVIRFNNDVNAHANGKLLSQIYSSQIQQQLTSPNFLLKRISPA